jgi:phage terminase large subunit-like protein
MSAPTKRLEELVIGGKLAHAGHPVLRWMAGNVAVEKDAADNWKPSKKKSRERIDGIVAIVIAVDRETTQPPEPECWYVPGNLDLMRE